jgi:arsenate reductase
MKNKNKVLFLCNEDSPRSQMAVDFLSQYGGEFFEVFSAQDPRNVNQMTWQVMNEIGHNPSNPITKPILTGEQAPHYDYVVTLDCHANINDLVVTTSDGRMDWCVDEPVAAASNPEQQLQQYRSVRDQVQAAVLDWLFEKGVALD